MKSPTFAPIYVAIFPILSEIAQKHGYSLCVHGSIQRDFDLVAIPWIPNASTAETLVDAFAEYLNVISKVTGLGNGIDELPEHKSHGRRAWNLYIGCGSQIDLSIMPLINNVN